MYYCVTIVVMLADVTGSIISVPVYRVAYETSHAMYSEKCVHLCHGMGPSVSFFMNQAMIS